MAVPDGMPVNLVIEETFIRRSTELMTSDALARVNSITVVLEGSGSIVPNNRLDRVLELADQANAHGVKTFKVQIFDTMNLDVLAQDHDQWNKIINDQYITLLPVSFSKLGKQISDGYETNVLGKIIKTFGFDLKTAFTKSPKYDENKKLLVFFGSSRNSTVNSSETRKGGDYNNMMLIDSYLKKSEITDKYNIAIKPHPKLAWINTYISESGIDASYFSSMPYELLVIAGGKNIDGFSVPVIDRVDSTYSTILFSVDVNKIHSIIDYSPYTGFTSEKDSIEFMKKNYNLGDGWGINSYEDYASTLKYQLSAPHVEVTNVEAFVNN
ncbi:hypothetical protein CF119_09930 [Aeromonas sobria]|nr:hypothetical protein CF119_09930 [Aeromonas sobria]